MTELERDLLEDVVHFSGASGEKRLAARNAGKFIQNALTFHAQRTAGIAAAQYPNAVKHDIRLFQEPSQFIKGVSRIIVLAIANQKQRTFRMSAALDLFNAEIAGVV